MATGTRMPAPMRWRPRDPDSPLPNGPGSSRRDTVSAAVSASLFAGQWVALDIAMRGLSPYAHGPRAALGAVTSVAVSYLIWTLRGRGPARGLVAAIAGTVMVSEWLFFRYYHAPIDAQVIASALHNWADVRPVVLRALPRAVPLMALATLVECALLARRATRSPRWPAVALLLVSVSVSAVASAPLAPSLRDATPELRLASAVTLLWAPRDARAATTRSAPSSRSTRTELPSVLFVLTESVRAADYCTAHDAACDVSPEVDALLPDRVPLRELRAVASYTAVSLSALISGRTQEGSRAEILSAPTVFDLLHAVQARGADAPPGGPGAVAVAYWSSQSEAVFEHADVRRAIDSFVTLETLLGHAVEDEDTVVARGVDRMLAAHLERALPSLPSPSFTLLHFSGTHAPYFVDEADAPFQPSRHEVTWSGLPALHGAYRNAIHAQDKTIAECIRAFLAARGARPWIVVLTSDHGEAFGEHGAIHHGQNLLDEQLHVPGFIAYGGGALTAEEGANLRAYEGRSVTHLDLLPTLLDAYGVLDDVALASVRRGLRGRSLIATPAPMATPLPMTNCTAMFPCPISTWGMLGERYAIEAQPWDAEWICQDLAAGAARAGVSGASGASAVSAPDCRALANASTRYFPELPNRTPNR